MAAELSACAPCSNLAQHRATNHVLIRITRMPNCGERLFASLSSRSEGFFPLCSLEVGFFETREHPLAGSFVGSLKAASEHGLLHLGTAADENDSLRNQLSHELGRPLLGHLLARLHPATCLFPLGP